MKHPFFAAASLFTSSLLFPAGPSAAVDDSNIGSMLDDVTNGPHRSADNKARDVYRHPRETLQFFRLQPDMRVLEITPGAGWYTELLAPLLKDEGELVVASFGNDHPVDYLAEIHRRYMQKLDANPAVYSKARRVLFKEHEYLQALHKDSFDMVVTFRNTHNWIKQGEAEAVYRAIYRVLKPCGTLGVVQHRAEPGADPKASAEQGYVPEDYLIGLLETIGFKLVARSEINANLRDAKDYPEGVWTLPPTYRLGNENRKKYATIGESDRMTLRLVKPLRIAGGDCPPRTP